jgi:hypothetical protein
MTEENPFRIFPSHGWVRDDDYLRLFEYLESTTNFFYRNVCDPDSSPEGESVAERRARIVGAMKEAEVLLVMAGMYAEHRQWLDFEMQAALANQVPIVLIEHFGPQEAPEALKAAAAQVVGWNSRSIEDAVRMQARADETKRFDVIEFDL